MPLYTAFTIDELSLPLQKENALGVPGAQQWVNDLPNEENKKFVADYRKKYTGLRPTFYGAQSYDAAQLINSAVVAVKGDTSKKDEMKAAMEKANFKSVRGDIQVRQQPHPDPELLPAGRGEGRRRASSLKTVATIVKDSQDKIPRQMPDEVIWWLCNTAAAHDVAQPPRAYPVSLCDMIICSTRIWRRAQMYCRCTVMPRAVHAACRRTIPERTAVRPAAVSAGGGIDAGVRHHGLRQSGARLALHDGRLFRGDLRGVDRQFRARLRCWRSARRCCSASCWNSWRCGTSTAAIISITCWRPSG